MTVSGVPPEGVAWGLAAVRVLALFLVAPVFGHLSVPVRVRVGLALGVTVALLPVLPELPAGPAAGPWGLAGAVLGEVLSGVTLGFAVQLIFAAFGLLGEFVSIQGGLGAARVLDPTSGASSVALASLFQVFALLGYLAIGGHHDLLRALADSLHSIPLGGGGPERGAFAAVVGLGGSIFSVAARLAAPVTVAVFVANLALGILGRIMPQLNLMTVQLPAHIAFLLILLLLGATRMSAALAGILDGWTATALGAVAGG